jgi:hypothetical protein
VNSLTVSTGTERLKTPITTFLHRQPKTILRHDVTQQFMFVSTSVQFLIPEALI